MAIWVCLPIFFFLLQGPRNTQYKGKEKLIINTEEDDFGDDYGSDGDDEDDSDVDLDERNEDDGGVPNEDV